MPLPTHFRRTSATTSGMVLIVVIGMLAIAVLVLLAFFSGTSQERMDAASSASMARMKMLADTAAALVIGQIEEASMQTNVAWISQPGLLRTYTTNSVRTPAACYKLYSTASLTNLSDTSGSVAFLAGDVPANWSATPEQYTDLNAPVTTSSGAM